MMRLRFPSYAELAFQALALAVFIVVLDDLLVAVEATTCGEAGAEHGCYPWGSESESWFYRSKELYVLASILQMGFLTGSIIAPCIASTPWRGLAAFFGISGGGTLALYAVDIFL
ncbi:hypothetical protein [Microvirga alba]|uniref:Uncharacterized protein n=1 Tax=Microvirga alba TaxID=2791025 RepID=A0A931FNQ4_9HYPH|nr:hypothetical protein [Microvirga alba]MBF9232582.1 hypothetical protein [Microvirga alba]